jgi:hypothetical protein
MLSILAITAGLLAAASAESVSITPHVQYSSTIGVPGCHVDVNRIAYFPKYPDCDNLCLEVSANGRKVNLLHVDVSGSAYDISYDAYNYLVTGASAKDQPIQGGGVPADVKPVDMSNCADIIKTPDGKLPMIATNPNFYTSCPPSSWVGKNTALYNIKNLVCTIGFNEVCTLDLAVSNQASCPHMLGASDPLSGLRVFDMEYGTGAALERTQ